jgi:hypothetical protein
MSIASRLTVVRIEGEEHQYVGAIPMPFQALHMCTMSGEVVVNAFGADHALVRMNRDGSELASYLPLTDLSGSAPTPEARAYVGERMGIGIPLCRGSGNVNHVPEWGAVVRGFGADGVEEWRSFFGIT